MAMAPLAAPHRDAVVDGLRRAQPAGPHGDGPHPDGQRGAVAHCVSMTVAGGSTAVRARPIRAVRSPPLEARVRTSGRYLMGLWVRVCVGACPPQTECPLTGAFTVRVVAPVSTPSPWLADIPSCGEQMDLPLGTVISFDTLGLDDDCIGTAVISLPTVVQIRETSGRLVSGYFGSPVTEGFVFARLPSGCEGGWAIQVTNVDRRVQLARSFTPEVAGSCTPIPAPVGSARIDCIDFFEAALVE